MLLSLGLSDIFNNLIHLKLIYNNLLPLCYVGLPERFIDKIYNR